MQDGRRWSFIPRTKALCAMWIAIGALLLGRAVWRLADTGHLELLDIVAAVPAALLIVLSVVGLVSPRLRGH